MCGRCIGTDTQCREPLTRYEKLRVAHAPGMPGTFSRPPTSNETVSSRSRHASRHVRHAFPLHAPPAMLPICQEAHTLNDKVKPSSLPVRSL